MEVEPLRCAFLERGRRDLGRGRDCGWGHRKEGGGAGAGAGDQGSQRGRVRWLVALSRHGSALLALVALVGMASDPAASFREHPE